MHRTLFSLAVSALLCSCAKPMQDVSIDFVARWQGADISCGTDDSQAAMSDLRFFVSNVVLVDGDGRIHRLKLQPDDRWQQHDLAMIDLEDGTARCQNGSAEKNTVLRGALPAGNYRGLSFTVGVPFDRNHADPLQAEAPLNDPSMHWHWRSGYMFLRAGLNTESDGYRIHLGSAACEGTMHDITGCRFPNRVSVQLDEFEPGQSFVVFDFDALLADIDLDDGERGDCTSGPMENQCSDAFRALGIDFDNGVAGYSQTVFSSERRR